MPKGFWNDFRRFFLRGLAAMLPALLTVVIIIYVFNFVQDRIGHHINRGVIYILSVVRPHMDEDQWTEWWNQHSYLNGVGFVLAIIGIYFIGRFMASFIGRSIWRVVERGLTRTPVVKQIYPNVKQVTDFFLSERRLEFSRVVAVEYPRKGIWSLGLVTGPGMRQLAETLDSDLLTVFVPSSPTPVTGYTIVLRRDEVIDLPLSIDEALRFTVSGGVVVPPAQRLPQLETGRVKRPFLSGAKTLRAGEVQSEETEKG